VFDPSDFSLVTPASDVGPFKVFYMVRVASTDSPLQYRQTVLIRRSCIEMVSTSATTMFLTLSGRTQRNKRASWLHGFRMKGYVRARSGKSPRCDSMVLRELARRTIIGHEVSDDLCQDN
jgi:hypothetical protein